MRAFYSRLPAALSIAPWAYFLWSGYDLCYGRATTPPNSGQLHLYVVAPAVGTAVAVVLLAFAHKTPRGSAGGSLLFKSCRRSLLSCRGVVAFKMGDTSIDMGERSPALPPQSGR